MHLSCATFGYGPIVRIRSSFICISFEMDATDIHSPTNKQTAEKWTHRGQWSNGECETNRGCHTSNIDIVADETNYQINMGIFCCFSLNLFLCSSSFPVCFGRLRSISQKFLPNLLLCECVCGCEWKATNAKIRSTHHRSLSLAIVLSQSTDGKDKAPG